MTEESRVSRTPRTLLGWTVPEHIEINTTSDNIHHITCRHVRHEGGFPGRIFHDSDEYLRGQIGRFLFSHGHGDKVVAVLPDAPEPQPEQCDATSAWSDGVTTRCQLPAGHEGEHRDDRREAVNPLEARLQTLAEENSQLKADIGELECDVDALQGEINDAVTWLSKHGYAANAQECTMQQNVSRAVRAAERAAGGSSVSSLSDDTTRPNKPATSPLSREELGRRVADVCVQWSREDDEREGASATWDVLNSHRRELYMRVGEALFALGMTFSPSPARGDRERRQSMIEQINGVLDHPVMPSSEKIGAIGVILDAQSLPKPALSGVELRDAEERDDASGDLP